MADAAPRRGLRDSIGGRLAILGVVLVLALVSAKACGGTASGDLGRDEAIEVARTVAVFEPDGIQVRFVNRGIPPRGTWIVSLHNGPARNPTAVQTVLVDAATGTITDDGTP